jgi:hypothetical protein
MTAMEDCLAEVIANGTQAREGLHDLRSKLQVQASEYELQEQAVKQVQKWMGGFSGKLDEVHEMVTNLQATRQSDVKETTRRLRALESISSTDEVTKS